MLRVALFTGALLLSGCGPEVMAEALYPGGQVVALRSSDGESVMQYGCAPEGPGGKTVTERAAAARTGISRPSLTALVTAWSTR